MTGLRLAAAKAWQLKYWAFLTGVQTTGTKAELQALLTNRLNEPPILNRPTKIVSVDMGIRNLAYCAIEAPLLDQDPKVQKEALQITAWHRLDLTQSESQTPTLFHPSHLSHTALSLTRTLLSHSPTTILLERQRYRSSSSPSIQEWTVRVNMLESMIWACLRTLRETASEREGFPEVLAVNPAQVAGFWGSPLAREGLREGEDEGVKAMMGASGKVKLEKKGKVELVKKWCSQGAVDEDVKLDVGKGAEAVARAFREGKRKKKDVNLEGENIFEGKLDDVADCLLQGVTWVRWEQNRRLLAGTLKDAFGDQVHNDSQSDD